MNGNETNPVPVEENELAEMTEEKKIQSDQLRFILPLELKKLMRLPN